MYVQKENKFHLLHKCIDACNSIRFNMYAQEGTARSFICCSGKRDRQESNMDCALMVTGAALQQISHESLMEESDSAREIFDDARCPDI